MPTVFPSPSKQTVGHVEVASTKTPTDIWQWATSGRLASYFSFTYSVCIFSKVGKILWRKFKIYPFDGNLKSRVLGVAAVTIPGCSNQNALHDKCHLN